MPVQGRDADLRAPGEIRIAVRASGNSAGETLLRSGSLREMLAIPMPYRTGFDAAHELSETRHSRGKIVLVH